MKKMIILLILLSMGAGLAFSQNSSIKFAVGGGVSYLNFTNDQQASLLGQTLELKQTYGSMGINAFFDLTQYLTINLGYRFGLGDASMTASAGGSSATQTASNALQNFEIGAELKYPIAFNSSFSLAPKVGILDEIYTSGDVGGSAPSTTDAKQSVSPLLLTVGADLNFMATPQVLIRLPLDVGFGLNSKLSDSYYGGTYSSSSIIAFRAGVEIGYLF